MSPVQTPDGIDTVDCRSVASAATLLGLREFDYFRLAYRRWFGEQPYPDRLERAFVDYMMQQRVPPWVRMLTWQVLDASRAGTLEPTAFGAERYRDRPRRPRAAPAYIAGVAVAWLLMMGALVDLESPPAVRYHADVCGADRVHIAGTPYGKAIISPAPDHCR